MPDRSPVSLLQQLVRIPSGNPRGAPRPAEAAIGAAVAGWLRDAGLEVELQAVLPGRPNVLGRVRGRDRSRVFLLESHLDTVETDGMTAPPFAAEIREGRLFGRGACHAKGPLAAMMLAMAELARGAAPPVDVLLAAVMDEGWRPSRPGTAAAGEPYVVDYAMATDPAEPVVRQLEEAVRRAGRPAEIRGVHYGTDASKLARAGIPAVVFGPGSIRQAHSADEWIELRQVDEAAAFLAATIRAFA